MQVTIPQCAVTGTGTTEKSLSPFFLRTMWNRWEFNHRWIFFRMIFFFLFFIHILHLFFQDIYNLTDSDSLSIFVAVKRNIYLIINSEVSEPKKMKVNRTVGSLMLFSSLVFTLNRTELISIPKWQHDAIRTRTVTLPTPSPCLLLTRMVEHKPGLFPISCWIPAPGGWQINQFMVSPLPCPGPSFLYWSVRALSSLFFWWLLRILVPTSPPNTPILNHHVSTCVWMEHS